MIRRAVSFAGALPTLRQRVGENMRLALGVDPPDEPARRYFRQAGWLVSKGLETFHQGLGRSLALEEIKLGPTVAILDEAVAEGRGVILTSPHWTGHELAAAVVGRRYPMAMLVRQSPEPDRAAYKAHWYRSLGVETVLRPAQASKIRDAVAYLNVLKQKKLLFITPDLLAGAGQGVEVSLFGRRAKLHGGAFAFALATGAPVLRFSVTWQPDETIMMTFERASPPPEGVDRDAAVQACAQDWCNWLEACLQKHPENWLFWLDRRWSAFLRDAERAGADG